MSLCGVVPSSSWPALGDALPAVVEACGWVFRTREAEVVGGGRRCRGDRVAVVPSLEGEARR